MILLTGAAGKVGTMLRPMLLEKYGRLRLSDTVDIGELSPGESFLHCHLGNVDEVKQMMEGVTCVIHLGGISSEAAWPDILESNVQGCINVFESARNCGVSRIVFASSNHVMGFYERDNKIGADCTVRPDSRYGVSKAFGEALAAFYADKFGIRTTCLRIGNVDWQPIDRRRLSIWIHPADLFQLICIGIDHPSIHFEILYGMSASSRAWWDNSRAASLGYKPAHNADDHAERVLSAEETPDPIGDRFQGGSFCSHEYSAASPSVSGLTFSM